MAKKRLVMALGHDALGTNLPEQKEAVARTAKTIGDFIQDSWQVAVVHSNAPQLSMIHTAMNEFGRHSMILQPIVENAVNHGIRNIDWEGWIHLCIRRKEEYIQISVKDNGKGISRERIRQILDGEITSEEEAGDSTGVGMNNVISRLELYYGEKGLLSIQSQGEDLGTEVIIQIPDSTRC